MEAYNLKLQGVTSGVSDTFLAVPNNHFAGLFIEFKVGHNKLTNNQTAFLKAVTSQKYATATIYDFDSFRSLISKYLNNDEYLQYSNLVLPISQFPKSSCPSGWRVPSVADVNVLKTAVPDCVVRDYVFNQLCLNNVNFTSYGFGADLKGYRVSNTGKTYDAGVSSHYLLSNRTKVGNKWAYNVMYVESTNLLAPPNSNNVGYSIRCIKNIQGVPGQD